jgi:hypothetical protein
VQVRVPTAVAAGLASGQEDRAARKVKVGRFKEAGHGVLGKGIEGPSKKRPEKGIPFVDAKIGGTGVLNIIRCCKGLRGQRAINIVEEGVKVVWTILQDLCLVLKDKLPNESRTIANMRRENSKL